jgi:cell filamentation protein
MNRPRDDLIFGIAELCGDLNVIHPFREGNGRALRLFCEFVIVDSGHEISWQNLSEEEWLQASIEAVNCNYSAMQTVFNHCIGVPITD